MSDSNVPSWLPTREEGLKRLHWFLPKAGLDYARRRNFDLGPEDRSNITALSPYVRHRLVLEEELVEGAIARHGYEPAEKFVQEVVWRTYFKGWMEQRPDVWTDYRSRVRELYRSLDDDPSLRNRWEAAVEGTTGIACFDAWSNELVQIGFLHNHTRMWHASLWIFTLKLPWELGADFYARHLLDADASSNTLSWRWVAGIQTRGKTYLAEAGNIEKYTEGRFRPTEPFAEFADPIEYPPEPSRVPIPRPDPIEPMRTGLLLTEDDLCDIGWNFRQAELRTVATALANDLRSPLGTSPAAQRFAEGAARDGLARAAERFQVASEFLEGDWNVSVVEWVERESLEQVITPFVPLGPAREKLDRLEPVLKDRGVQLVRLQRPWDQVFLPLATAGFFRFKTSVPGALKILNVDLEARSDQASLPFS